VLACVEQSGLMTSRVNHVADVLLQRQRQRQSVDASSARIRHVSRHYGSTTILQAAETAHAGDQRHLRLGRCVYKNNAVLDDRLTVYSSR